MKQGRNLSFVNYPAEHNQDPISAFMQGLKSKDSLRLVYDSSKTGLEPEVRRDLNTLLVVAFYVTGLCLFCDSPLLPRNSENLRFCSSCRWGVGHKKEVSQLK